MYYICHGAREVIITAVRYGPTGSIGHDTSEKIYIKKGGAVKCGAMSFPTYFREASNAEIVCIYGGAIPCADLSDRSIVALQVMSELPVEFITMTFDISINLGGKDEK
jgi:hypothetical protein